MATGTEPAVEVIDLAQTPLRELNAALHAPHAPERVLVRNPGGRHNLAVGLDAPISVELAGPAGYLTWRLREGADLREALEGCLRDLDGFFTFAVGTIDGFAVLRDPIACKPAVMAETDDWVAMASEYRAIAVLPGAESARTWEPEPGRVYSWERAAV